MSKREEILSTIKDKVGVKQQVYDNTYEIFLKLKEVLQEYAVEINENLEGADKRVRMIYQDRGKFEVQLQVASDVIIFSMHSNVFMFDRSNVIWRNSYVEKSPANAYCGVINIYNFLSDSLKYNRMDDEGYLIGRIFINREYQYLVEGKRQVTARHDSFGSGAITSEALIDIIENCINYAVAEFDLLVPPYDLVKQVTVEQLNTKIEHSKLQTGKRLGYQYRSDDV